MNRRNRRWRVGALLCAILIGLSVDIGAAAQLDDDLAGHDPVSPAP